MSACLSLSQSLPPFHLSFNKDLWARRSIFTIFQPNNFAVSLLPIWKPRPRKVKETTHSPSLRRGLTRVCLVSKYTFLPSHCSQNWVTKNDLPLLSRYSWDMSYGGMIIHNQCWGGAEASGREGTEQPGDKEAAEATEVQKRLVGRQRA